MKWNCVIVSAFVLAIYVVQAKNVTVSLYYESLCPDSIKFITTQLFPSFKTIGSEMVVDLVPFGRATVVNDSGKIEFTCDHGPDECYGNEIQSCAIALYSVEESTGFVYCAMASDDPSSDSNLEECANSAGISWSDLKTCYSSGRGDELLVANGVRTNSLQPALSSLPTVIFNGQFNQALQDEALTELEEVLCQLLDDEPAACKQDAENDIVVELV